MLECEIEKEMLAGVVIKRGMQSNTAQRKMHCKLYFGEVFVAK